MAKISAVKPSLMPAVMALLLLLLFGYLLFTDATPSRQEHTLGPPIDIIDPLPPVTVIESTEPAPTAEEVIQQDAETFVEALVPPQLNEPVEVTENKDQFIRHDGIVSLPNLENRNTTVSDLLNDDQLAPDTKLIISYLEKEESLTSLSDLAKNIEDHTAEITVILNDGVQLTAPLADILNRPEVDHSAPVTLVEKQIVTQQLTMSELNDSALSPNQSLQAIIEHGSQEIAIKDIVQSDEIPEHALFYLHRVTERDRQGLWGIIQAGLIDKFREGVHIEGIKPNKDLMKVTIPNDADEKLSSGLSSFLGKLLNSKVTSSYIYNFNTKTIGRDPNIIFPGQQLILIHFSGDELEQVYQFFSSRRNQDIETFAITD